MASAAEMEAAMMNCKARAGLAMLLAGLLASPALAQSAGSSAAPAAAVSDSQGASGAMGPGMMGRGMWGQGGMGQAGMGQAGMGRGMWGQGGMGRMGMGPWGMARHVEGWLAFLKTELKVTDAQQKLWDRVAAALRANAHAVTEMRRTMMATAAAATLPERLAAREKLLTARLDALRTYKGAVDPFYAALSEAQKKTADDLMPAFMGIGRAMMGGGGMMGGGPMGRMGAR
jgi:LTXXQ motif family protein